MTNSTSWKTGDTIPDNKLLHTVAEGSLVLDEAGDVAQVLPGGGLHYRFNSDSSELDLPNSLARGVAPFKFLSGPPENYAPMESHQSTGRPAATRV